MNVLDFPFPVLWRLWLLRRVTPRKHNPNPQIVNLQEQVELQEITVFAFINDLDDEEIVKNRFALALWRWINHWLIKEREAANFATSLDIDEIVIIK